MLARPTLILVLAATEPAEPLERLDARRAELDECAERIEALKSRQEVGRELDRLLRRAQQLASELERTAAGDIFAAPTAPSPEELRERADAARDEADRLAADIAALDVRIEDARRARAEPGGPVARAALGGPAVIAVDPAARLAAERAVLAEKRARAIDEASRLEREAREAETDL